MKQKITLLCILAFLFLLCGPKKSMGQTMDQRLSIITIGVDSLQAMRNFYIEKFGWKPVAENEDIVFFKLNGFLFGLYPAKKLADFAATSPEKTGFRPFTLAYMVDSEQKVIDLYNLMKGRGVKIMKEPQVPPIGGYYFLMADIEGNIWEVAYNLFMPLDEKGNVITHKHI